MRIYAHLERNSLNIYQNENSNDHKVQTKRKSTLYAYIIFLLSIMVFEVTEQNLANEPQLFIKA